MKKRKFPPTHKRAPYTPPSTIKFQINSIYFIFFILFVPLCLYYFILYTHFSFFFYRVPCSLSTRCCFHRLNCLLLFLNSNKFTYNTHTPVYIVVLLWKLLLLWLCQQQQHNHRERERKKENFTRDAKETEKDYGMCRSGMEVSEREE